MSKTELFVGNLDQNIQRIDIENVFEKYGKILRCDIKNKGRKRKKAHGNIFLLNFIIEKAWDHHSVSWNLKTRKLQR